MRADRRLFVVEADIFDVYLAGVRLDAEHGAILRFGHRRESIPDVAVESEVAVSRSDASHRRAGRHVLGNTHLLVTSQPAPTFTTIRQGFPIRGN